MTTFFALQLNPHPAGMAPAAHTLPLALGGLNVQQQLQPQVSSTMGFQLKIGERFLLDGSLTGRK